MAQATVKIILVTALMAAALVIPASAQAGCTTALIGLAPCLSYISGNASTPSASCCSQLASVVQSQPQCLCTVLNGGGSSFGISINQTQALALPGACKVQTPPVSQCKNAGAGGSATSPAETPKTSPSSPTTPSVETPSGIPAVPSSPSGDPTTPAAAAPANGSKSTSGDSSDGILSKPAVWKVLSAVTFISCISSLSSFF